MKVYVDELPENCAEWNCPFNYDICRCRYKEFVDVGDRDIEYDYEKGRPINCPLQSLSDYTKKVRKEVCDKIREMIIDKTACKMLSNGTICISLKKINDVLDQIQGE